VPELLRFRRLLGLLTFGYACLHLLCYTGFDMGFEWSDIVHDIPKRPFVLVGTLAFALLLPLAATSWNGAIRRLGPQRWQALHRSVYAIAVLAVLHFWWMRAGKQNFTEVWVYGLVLAGLLVWRMARHWRADGRGLEGR
jgi:methionine sulfoxide reductase heme-binding subunit